MVKALLEAGERELLMLTGVNEASCLIISALRGHLEVVKALLEVGGRELLMLTMHNGANTARTDSLFSKVNETFSHFHRPSSTKTARPHKEPL